MTNSRFRDNERAWIDFLRLISNETDRHPISPACSFCGACCNERARRSSRSFVASGIREAKPFLNADAGSRERVADLGIDSAIAGQYRADLTLDFYMDLP